MPPNGVKTRAQRKKEAAGGAPASPIQMLPLTAPRRAPKRKPTASNATRESTSAATSGSEAENTKETIESQEHTSESTEPETVVESIEKPENINSEAQNSPLVPGISVSQSAPIAAGSPAHRSASPSPSPSRPTQNRNYAVLQLWVNADGDVLNAKRPASQPTVALAVPMEHLANCLRKLAMDYPGAPNAPLLSTSVGTKVPTTEVKKRKAMVGPREFSGFNAFAGLIINRMIPLTPSPDAVCDSACRKTLIVLFVTNQLPFMTQVVCSA